MQHKKSFLTGALQQSCPCSARFYGNFLGSVALDTALCCPVAESVPGDAAAAGLLGIPPATNKQN